MSKRRQQHYSNSDDYGVKGSGKRGDRQDREFRGIVQEVENAKSSNEKYNLAWFKPVGRQQDIVDAIDLIGLVFKPHQVVVKQPLLYGKL